MPKTIEQGDDGDFVGKGEIETAKAEGAGSLNRRREVSGGDFHVDVAPIETVMGKGGFDHSDGRVAGGALRHGADEFRAEGGGHVVKGGVNRDGEFYGEEGVGV